MPEPIPWPEGTPEHIRRPIPPLCPTCNRIHPPAPHPDPADD